MSYIVAIDEGTTSTRAVLYDLDSKQIVMQKAALLFFLHFILSIGKGSCIFHFPFLFDHINITTKLAL